MNKTLKIIGATLIGASALVLVLYGYASYRCDDAAEEVRAVINCQMNDKCIFDLDDSRSYMHAMDTTGQCRKWM